MKIINKYIFGGLMACATLGINACSDDFLDRPPLDQQVAESFYTSAEALRSGTAPLYGTVWFEYNNSAYSMVDSRAGEIYSPHGTPSFYMFTLSSVNQELSDSWISLHKVISQSNTTISNIKKYAQNVTETQKNQAIAEARFMRGTAYLNLVRLWGPVIIIEDNLELALDAVKPLNRIEDVYQFAINDLSFAANHLPASDTPGRLTKWAAKGMLAKAYLAYSGYNNNGSRNQALLDSAVLYSRDVCVNSGLSLMENYSDLFTYANNNNKESLFSLQWVPLGEWGYQNATLANLAHSDDVLGGIKGWSNMYASYDYLASVKENDTIRRNYTFMTGPIYYPEINQNNGGYTFTGSNIAPIRKYIPGGPDDGNDGKVAFQNSPLNTYMLRLADVYLIYAEASLGNKQELTESDGSEALSYFNKVRKRAKVEEKSSITFDDIMYERRIEFGMESQRWYDLVSWYYFKPETILSYINGQKRGTSYSYVKNSSGNLTISTPEKIPVVIATAKDMYFPYPEADVVQNPKMKEAPVAYDFSQSSN